jgi:hypothetical protein
MAMAALLGYLDRGLVHEDNEPGTAMLWNGHQSLIVKIAMPCRYSQRRRRLNPSSSSGFRGLMLC